jgi:Ca-activated chloride channel family protein
MEVPKVDPLKYRQTKLSDAATGNELLTVKIRHKKPKADESTLITIPVPDTGNEVANTSADFRFAASVAEFGLLLRNSEYKGTATYEEVIQLAQGSRGEDEFGYRAEFVALVRDASELHQN